MKILQVIPYFCFGGAEIMCENLILAQKELGHQVIAVSLYDDRTPIAARLEEAGVKIRYLDKKLGLDVSMVPKLTKIMKEEKPDVVHTHLDVIKYAVLAAKLAGVKTCVHTVHSVAHKEAEGRLQKIINGTYYRLGLSVPVALSNEIQESIEDFYGIDDDKIPVIRNGIDLSRCTPKGNYSLEEAFTIVHVGRFDVPKNHGGMLRAFRKFHDRNPQARLRLVGDGDLRPQMEELAKELEITQWSEFCGMQKNVHPYLQSADIFTLPSVYEGNPMTIIEAMGTGLPIAASRVGGIPDMLEEGEDALLFPPEEEAICAAWQRLLEDTQLRERLGRKARENSVKFSAEHMAREYCRLYERMSS